MKTPDKKQHYYTALFCEENIWKLVESSLTSNSIIPIDALFIINPFNSIALFEQTKSIAKQAVIWDYHVVLSALLNKQIVIFDFDSRCEFPCNINTYFDKTFSNYSKLHNHYKPFLKPIKADNYYQNFTSDRSHMKGIIPQSEFPSYDIIMPNNATHLLTLEACRTLNSESSKSDILTPHEYLEHLNSTIKPNL